ncbi:MAG: TolC family protein [Flavobacterium sp.]|uniref:TolC family protein n=1 Tax=Flavobacterium sp. TaxID=239 RepID=UPI0026299E91|nr:TolC family protein [Flavobacterium sp.]MDD5152181.1 TolC family protein [Flavobacterium sp.]
MKQTKTLLMIVILITQSSFAQTKLENYIEDGLKNNETIKQQNFILSKSIYALEEAKTLFLPNVNFNTTYTRADGGRTIDIPLGDLLNPAYTTLNQLTGTNNFPSLENKNILLNPNNYYDAKFRTSMPLLNAEIIYNKKIKKQQVDLQKIEIDLYKRELVKEIKIAYYKYSQSVKAIEIYKSALKLVQENKRINTSLFNNDKVNRTSVIRSENEVSKINALLITAQQNEISAKQYFNFLLNKPLQNEINVDDLAATPLENELGKNEVSNREEILKLKSAQSINDNVIKLNKSYLVPKIGTFIDLGSQAFDWKFNDKSRYYLFGVALDWNFFSFGKNSYKTKQTQADQDYLQSQEKYVEQQLLTQLSVTKNNFQSAIANYEASKSQLITADKYYADIQKMYKEGQVIFIELLDAQNQLINAQLQSNISLYDTWIKDAEIERANASFKLNN